MTTWVRPCESPTRLEKTQVSSSTARHKRPLNLKFLLNLTGPKDPTKIPHVLISSTTKCLLLLKLWTLHNFSYRGNIIDQSIPVTIELWIDLHLSFITVAFYHVLSINPWKPRIRVMIIWSGHRTFHIDVPPSVFTDLVSPTVGKSCYLRKKLWSIALYLVLHHSHV